MEELIEKYLLGKLSDEDKQAFELKMKQNPDFAQKVEIQKDLMEASRILGYQKAVSVAWKSVVRIKIVKGTIVAVIVTVAAIAALQLFNRNDMEHESKTSLYDSLQYTQIDPISKFNVDNQRDTIIETHGGLVVLIPAGAFETANGSPVKNYEVTIVEGLTALDIMKNGWTTMSDSSLLETAGMYNLVAMQNGDTLKIKEGRELIVHVPADEVDPDMMLFDGVDHDGNVNWINPRPIVKYLVTRPFAELDFYPEGYLPHLGKRGLNTSDVDFTDSLYYSFSCGLPDSFQSAVPTAIMDRDTLQAITPPPYSRNSRMEVSNVLNSEMPAVDENYQVDTASGYLQICPASIKAIRQPEFANTFIATEEFAMRLKHIFNTCNESFLNVYINNLDKDLWVSDSIVASMMSGDLKKVFTDFAAQKLGNTNTANPAFAKLSAYFEKKRKIFESTAARAIQKMYDDRRNEDEEMMNREIEKSGKRAQDQYANYEMELEINMREAYRQAGINDRAIYNPVAATGYTFPIQSTGLKNLDAYVRTSTSSRTTLSTTYNGKKVKIRYEGFVTAIQDIQKYDMVECYLIPDKLRSYQRMTRKGDKFNFNLNELLSYHVVCLARRGDVFYFAHSKVEEGKNKVHLIPMDMSQPEINQKLNSFAKPDESWNLRQEFQHEVERQVYDNKLRKRKADDQLRREIEQIIWPCLLGEGENQGSQHGQLPE